MSLIAFVFMLSAAASAQRVDEVPRQFIATWETSELGCELRSDRVMEIGREHVLFHETHGRIVSVVSRGEREVMLVLELKSEGETWLSSLHLTLEGDTLVQRRDIYDDDPVRRIACPGTRVSVKSVP